MTNIIKTYIDKHYNPKLDPLMVKRLSYQQSRKFQPFFQYLQLTKSQLFRQKDSPTGLRNIGNTCYLNIFLQLLYHVNDIRDMFIDSHFNKERLLMAIQGLFGKMVFSRYSFCDTEQVFEELNRGSGNKVSLGVQYDFHEYLSIQLDNIEKVLRSEGLEQKSGVLDKVFCGKYRQSVRAGEEVSVSESKFGMITLDGKIGDLRAAYDAFRNYKVEGYKTKKGLETGQVKIEIQKFPPLLSFFINRVTIDKGNLVKHNGEFTYPNYLQLDKTTNDFVYNLSEQDELLERKIQTIEDIIEKKQYKVILESLITTKRFLDEQSYETVTNASLDVEGIDNHFGIIGSEQTHQQTKSSISQYIKKLSNQQTNLLHILSTLKQQKRKSLETKKLQKYSLFALMIHAGSATSGHYYIFIYNESQKKWRKYSDRTVQQVPESLVHSIAQGKSDKETNVCCIIYKHPEFKCNPFEKPPIPASLKSKITESDYELGKIIDNLKVERMVRTCASLAEEEALFYQEEFAKKKGDMFVEYFSEIVNYFVSLGNIKMAELSRLKALLSEPSFRYEVGNLIGEKELTLPDIPLVVSKDYFNCLTIIRKALYFESINNIPSAIALLSFHTPSQPATLSYYNELILVFLFKACFYLDLYQQLSKDVRILLQVMNYALGLFKKNVYTDQLSANIRYSVPNAAEYLKEKVDLRKVAEMPAVDNVQMSIKGQLEGRLGVWKRMYVEIKETGKVLTQEQRNDIEMPLLIEEAKSIK